MKKSRINHALAVLLMAGYLFSCSESNLGTGSNNDPIATGNADAVAAKKSHGDSPQKVFEEFQEMVKKVEKMSKVDIDSLSDEEVLELGEPILKATENTVKFSKETLQKLQGPNSELIEKLPTITRDEHKALSEVVKKILASDKNRTIRNLDAADVRDLLINFSGGNTAMMSSCEDMFNEQNGNVILYVGDNFAIANNVCPPGTNFYIAPGTHTGQHVTYSKNGNVWTAYTSATMDGQGNTAAAFDGGLDNNTISLFTIKNYNAYGIVSTSETENIDITFMTFKNIAPNASGPVPGQENSAVYFEDTENLYIRYSNFEDVASGIRIRFSDGPLKILDNEALNSGRNFFQCDQCYGGNIRINSNSLDRTSSYGNAVLEDWINIHKSEGTSSDWIQVNDNRARGYAIHDHGAFIILGDGGGKYQEAVGNIGVRPGQVGIGVASGQNMKVSENKMYSDDWTFSNVAYYSANYYDAPCGNHEFPGPFNSTPNKANWTNANGTPNRAHSDENCGITNAAMQDSVVYDFNIDEDIWNEW